MLKLDTDCDTYDKLLVKTAATTTNTTASDTSTASGSVSGSVSATSTGGWPLYTGHDSITDDALKHTLTVNTALQSVVSFVHTSVRGAADTTAATKGDSKAVASGSSSTLQLDDDECDDTPASTNSASVCDAMSESDTDTKAATAACSTRTAATKRSATKRKAAKYIDSSSSNSDDYGCDNISDINNRDSDDSDAEAFVNTKSTSKSSATKKTRAVAAKKSSRTK